MLVKNIYLSNFYFCYGGLSVAIQLLKVEIYQTRIINLQVELFNFYLSNAKTKKKHCKLRI